METNNTTDTITLLAIDDQRFDLLTISKMVQDALPQAVVLTARNGPAGIELAAAEDPDVILLDIVMPDMDGFEVCRRLKADERLRDIPVIFLTALRTDSPSRVRALQVGAEGFLAKPLEAAELTAQILAMVKIKRATRMQQTEKERLEALAAERTRELQESNENFRNIVDNAPFGYYRVGKDGLWEYVNPEWERMHSLTLKEVAGKSFEMTQPPEMEEKARENVRRSLSGETITGEFSRMTSDGQTEYHTFCLQPCRVGGEIVAVEGFINDITDRKRAEAEREQLQAQLVQAQKVESIGRLAGGVAHDFNNLLGVILGYVEMAISQVDATHPLHDDLTEILKAARRAAELTEQLRVFARQQNMTADTLDLNTTIEKKLTTLRHILGDDIELNWRPGSRLAPIKADLSQIDQILVNLCANARDAIDGTGRVTIETARQVFDAAWCDQHAGFLPGTYVMLAVSDSGCGMDDATLKQAFDPFFTTREVGKGTGLGLSTIHGIVHQNQGFIHVNSRSGQGSVFQVYWPHRAVSGEQ